MVTEKIIRECIICEEFRKKYIKKRPGRQGIKEYVHKKTGLPYSKVNKMSSLYPKITGTEDFRNYKKSTTLNKMLILVRENKVEEKISPVLLKSYEELKKEVSTIKVDFQVMREEILDLRQIVKEIEQ